MIFVHESSKMEIILMRHTCYHILSDLHDQYCSTIEEVKKATELWRREGDDHFKIFKISTKEGLDADELMLDEKLISLNEIRKN